MHPSLSIKATYVHMYQIFINQSCQERVIYSAAEQADPDWVLNMLPAPLIPSAASQGTWRWAHFPPGAQLSPKGLYELQGAADGLQKVSAASPVAAGPRQPALQQPVLPTCWHPLHCCGGQEAQPGFLCSLEVNRRKNNLKVPSLEDISNGKKIYS